MVLQLLIQRADPVLHLCHLFVFESLLGFTGSELVPARLHLSLHTVGGIFEYFDSSGLLFEFFGGGGSVHFCFLCLMHLFIKILFSSGETFLRRLLVSEEEVGHLDHLLHLLLAAGYLLKGHGYFVFQVEIFFLF